MRGRMRATFFVVVTLSLCASRINLSFPPPCPLLSSVVSPEEIADSKMWQPLDGHLPQYQHQSINTIETTTTTTTAAKHVLSPPRRHHHRRHVKNWGCKGLAGGCSTDGAGTEKELEAIQRGGGGGGSSRQEGQSKAAALDRVILYGVPKQEMYHKQMGIYEELEGQRIDDRPCFKHCNNSSSSDFLYFSKEYGGWLVAPSLGNDKCYMFVSSSCRYPSSTTATWALWNGTSWRYDKRITVKDSTVRRPYQTRFHYNWDGGNPASEMPDVIPKPLSETQAKAIEEESSNRVSGASAWNSAGTWEEKSVKIWARARLGQLIEHIGALHVQDDDASFPGNRCRGDGGDGGKIIVFRIIKVNSVSGEADIVFIRNRRRYGVDMEARISIDVQMDAQSFTLNIKVELSNNQAGLPEFSIDWGGGDFWNIKKRERIKNAIKKGVIPPLSDQVATIIEEMKDK